MTLAQRLRLALEAGHASDAHLYSEDPAILQTSGHSPAAVLIAITEREEPGVILTRRADHLRTHAGQVALPGGRVDPTDENVVRAALREAEEEVGLSPDVVEIVGQTDPYKTFTGFEIIPVLGVIPPDLVLKPQEAEVESVFEAPLAFLLSATNHEPQTMEYGGKPRHFYEMWWDDYRIWGVTAAIFVNLSKRLSLLGTGL